MDIPIKRHLLAAFLLLSVCWGGYSNSLHTGFMLDDNQYFDSTMKNLKFLPFHFLPGHGTIMGFEKKNNEGYYRPLARAMYTVFYVNFGPDPVGYHVANIFFLWAAAFMFYLTAHGFLGPVGALMAAVLFAVHPLNSSMVDFIGAGVYLAQTALMLGALYGAVNAVAGKRMVWSAAGSVLLGLLAMLCHESAAALPLYAAALFWAVRLPLRSTWPLWLASAGYLLFRLCFTVILRNLFFSSSIYSMDVGAYLSGLGKVTSWYLWKLLCPSGIVFVWGTGIIHSAFWALGAFVIAAVLIAAIVWCRRAGEAAVALGVLWLTAAFIPAILGSISRPDIVCIEPHWMILGLAGFCLCLGRLLSRIKHGWAVALIIVSLYVYMDRQYNILWADEKKYNLYWMNEFPDFAPPKFYLADAYVKEHNLDAAKYYYGLAFGNPEGKVGNANYDIAVGVIEVQQRHWQRAKVLLEDAVRQDPQWAHAWTHLGVIAYVQGDLEKARRYFEHAISIDHFQILGRLNLGVLYRQKGEAVKAIEMYNQILKLEPNNEAALIELIQIYLKQGDSAGILKTARKLQGSRNPLVQHNLQLIFQKWGQLQL